MTVYQCENCDNNMKTHCFIMSACFMRDNRHCLFQDSEELRITRWEALGRWGRFKVKLRNKWSDISLDLWYFWYTKVLRR